MATGLNGNEALIAKTTNDGPIGSSANATAVVDGLTAQQYQVLGIGGSSSENAVMVQLQFDGVTQLRWFDGDTSGASVSEWFGPLGPVAGVNTAVSVVTSFSEMGAGATGACTAELIYRTIY